MLIAQLNSLVENIEYDKKLLACISAVILTISTKIFNKSIFGKSINFFSLNNKPV